VVNKALTLLTASVFIHGAILVPLNRAVRQADTRLTAEAGKLLLKREKEPIRFEFVDAPPVRVKERPKNTRRISNRDALNRSLKKARPEAAGEPAVKIKGVSNQITQSISKQSQQENPALKPREQEKQSEKKAVEGRDQPKAEPKTSIQGAPGNDKIIAREMSAVRSKGASLNGFTSFEATGSGMGEYMKNLKDKIWLSWFPYIAFQYPSDFHTADAIINVTLDAKGDVKKAEILHSEGTPIFAAYCMEAIRKAGGFGALPRELLALLGKEEFEIKFGFHYR